MKNKGIWIAILMILAAGIGFTSYTRSYVKGRQTEEVRGMTAAEGNSDPSSELPDEIAAGAAAAAETAGFGSYPARLEELDRELAVNREKERRSAAGYPAKARLENELALWQSEVDLLLDVLGEQLQGAEREALLQHQQEWIRNREARAVSASARSNGAASEELEYLRSQVSDTRARAYELAEEDTLLSE